MPSGRLELMDPMFAMYSGMHDSCGRAARQQWGSEGIWIPETVWFDGLDDLPNAIAPEMRELYLARKPWEQASAAFREWASTKQPHYSRVNWKDQGRWENGRWISKDKGTGPFGHTTHILGAGARIAELYWQRYQYTTDEAWLRDRAYPMLRGAAEFYRHFPNFKKGDDGRYHLYHVNNSESDWNTADTPYEVACLHMIFPTAVRAAEILDVDEDLRVAWQEIVEHLPPTPDRNRRGRRGFGAFVYGGPGEIDPLGAERELKGRFLSFTGLGGFIDERGIGGAEIFRNRMRLREGPGAIDAEHIAGLSGGIHLSLLDSTPPEPGAEPLVRLFSTWPKDWDAAFTLLARGAFLVSSVQESGQVPWVQIQSQVGGRCHVENPWPGRKVAIWRGEVVANELAGEKLVFSTQHGEIVVLAPQGSTPKAVRLLERD
jgi:hypothetical protein